MLYLIYMKLIIHKFLKVIDKALVYMRHLLYTKRGKLVV